VTDFPGNESRVRPGEKPARGPDVHEQEPAMARKLLAECVGTFFLTFVAAGGEMAGAMQHDVDHVSRAVAPGLVVFALIYAAGDVSGAHFNPAVTLAFAVRRVFRWSRVPFYWLAQLTGAVLAAAVLRALFGPVRDLGVTRLEVTSGRGLAIEILLTVLLVTVILNTATKHQLLGANSALPVGATIALCGLFAGTWTGASMNPARSIGPALVAAHFANLWVFVAGPILGGLAATGLSWGLHPHRHEDEEEAAEGDGGSTAHR
jgi:MIP family channel proteins